MRIVAGIHKNRTIVTPKGMATRPTSGRLREAVFNICQHYIEGARFLDLFAGSGAMGLEALSRGASQATFIDTSKDSALCIQKNLDHMKLQKQGRIYCGDVLQVLDRLSKLEEHYDIIFVDPPYNSAQGHVSEILTFLEQSTILSREGMLFLEVPKTIDIQSFQIQKLMIVSSRSMGRSSLHQLQIQSSIQEK